jgi:hypothetical protein
VFMHVTAAPLELMPGTPPPVTPRFSFVSGLSDLICHERNVRISEIPLFGH